MDILDDMGVSKLSAKVFSKVNYSFKLSHFKLRQHFFILFLPKSTTRLTLIFKVPITKKSEYQ